MDLEPLPGHMESALRALLFLPIHRVVSFRVLYLFKFGGLKFGAIFQSDNRGEIFFFWVKLTNVPTFGGFFLKSETIMSSFTQTH